MQPLRGDSSWLWRNLSGRVEAAGRRGWQTKPRLLRCKQKAHLLCWHGGRQRLAWPARGRGGGRRKAESSSPRLATASARFSRARGCALALPRARSPHSTTGCRTLQYLEGHTRGRRLLCAPQRVQAWRVKEKSALDLAARWQQRAPRKRRRSRRCCDASRAASSKQRAAPGELCNVGGRRATGLFCWEGKGDAKRSIARHWRRNNNMYSAILMNGSCMISRARRLKSIGEAMLETGNTMTWAMARQRIARATTACSSGGDICICCA